ncbi:MAG: hypothetical protein KGL39_36115 [Patescibacteria group bacterium]|nr:hypothetical protein [Patescibacteria group bacterium]
MPPYRRWTSKKQERWGNSVGKSKMSAADIAGKNRATKGHYLPESATKKKKRRR